MEKKTNTPALRFREFSGEWQNKAIVDLSETTYGGGTPATVNPDYWNGDIPWIQSSDISEENLWEVIPRKHISKSAVKESAAKIIPANSIAIIVRVGVGKLAFLPFSYATSQDFLSLSDLKIDEYFGTCAIWKRLQADLSKVQGTSIKGVTKEELLAKKVAVPVTEKEAKKIGELAYIFDQNIIHRQRKIADLERFRQAMLTKLFPIEGASEPALRFRGFSGPWKKERLGNIVDIQSGQDYKNLGPGTIPVYGTGGYMLSVDHALSYDKDAIGIGRKGTIDKPYILHAPFWTVDTLFYVLPQEGLDLNFAYAVFQKINWKALDESTGVPSLSKINIGNVVTYFPTYLEQQKIGNFFRQLDLYISLQKEKLDKMRLLKAALLDKLFV